MGFLMASFAHEKLLARKAVVLVNISEQYSVTLARIFTEEFEKAGGEVLWQGSYRGNAVNFEDLLEEVKVLRPDVLFIPGYARDSGLLISQAVTMGIETTFLGGDGWGEPMRKYAGDALLGSYYTSHCCPDAFLNEKSGLQRLYREKLTMDSIDDLSIALTYDAIRLFVDAARRAAGPDRDSIRDALAATENFRGVTGTITFDQNGDPMGKEAYVLKFQKDRSVLVHSLIQ